MVFENVGMEPSGDAFNSLIKLEGSNSHPYNPMINSGAIAVASYIEPKISFEEMLKLARCFCQDEGIVLDEKVYGSEMSTVARNRAIAYLLEQGRDQWKCGGSAGFLRKNVLLKRHSRESCESWTSVSQ